LLLGSFNEALGCASKKAHAQRVLGTHGHFDHGGLVVATALTLVFVPALYAAWFRVRRNAPAQDHHLPVQAQPLPSSS